MERTLEALAAYLKGRLIGDGTILVKDVNSLDGVSEGEVTFAEDAKHLAQALQTKAAAIIVNATVMDLKGRSGISVPNPKLAFALLLEVFHPTALPQGSIHLSALLGEQVKISHPVDIRANAIIGNRVHIGSGTVIEPGAYVGDDVTIGERCLIGPNVVIYRQTLIGDRVAIHGGSVIGGDGFGYVFHQGCYVKVPQVGNVVIEDDVEIGCNVCIDRATVGSTVIQRGTKMDNLVQIAHNNRIGRHVILAGQVGLAGSVTVGNHVRFGGKAGVVDHVTIGDRVDVGAASVVTKSVAPGEKIWGYPARATRLTLQQIASLGRLPSVLKTVAGLLMRFGRLEGRIDRLEAADVGRGVGELKTGARGGRRGAREHRLKGYKR